MYNRLNTVYLGFTGFYGQSICHEQEGKMMGSFFTPYKAAAPGSPFFRRKQQNISWKMSHLDAYQAPASASPFFSPKATKHLLKKPTSW